MVSKKTRIVLIRADQDFFDKIFEPARKRTQKKLGLMSLPQPKFTKMMQQSNLRLDVKLGEVNLNDVIKNKKCSKKRRRS